MTKIATKSLEAIERRMHEVDEDSIRYRILQNAKNFKTSWMDLGQALYSVWKDRLYKDWGYATFDTYTSKEIGIRKVTAMKLLKSYYFLEREEPAYLKKDYNESAGTAVIPTYESVNLLRLAKDKKKIDGSDYASLRRGVFENGKDPSQLKKDLTLLMRQKEELDPDEIREKKRTSAIKRLITSMKTLKTDIETSKMLPASIIREINELLKKLEAEIL